MKDKSKNIMPARQKRSAPIVARINAERAKSNLEAKISLLEAFINKAPSLDSWDRTNSVVTLKSGIASTDLPRSLRQFSKWAPDSSLCDVVDLPRNPMCTNSNDTLRKYPQQKVRAEAAMKMLASLKANDIFARGTTQNKLRRRLTIAENKLLAVEEEILVLSEKLYEEEKKRRIAEGKLQALQLRFREEISALEHKHGSNPERSSGVKKIILFKREKKRIVGHDITEE